MIINSWLRSHRPFITGMLNEGYSPWKISKIAKRQGWGIRHTDAMETIRDYAHIKLDALKAWRSTPLKYKPSDLKIPPFRGISAKRYLLETRITRRDVETGKIEVRSFRLGFEDMMTRGEIEEKVKDIGARAGSDYDKPLPIVLAIEKIEIYKS